MSKTRHFIALMCVLVMVLSAYALGAVLSARALGEAPTVEPESGWLVVQTLPTGALRCWELNGATSNPCDGYYYPRAHFTTEVAEVKVLGGDISCASIPDGNWPAAYEALRVSPSDCGQSRPALAGAQ